MKILYFSTLSSSELLNKIAEISHNDPSYCAQKFHKLIVEGMLSHKTDIEVNSVAPIAPGAYDKLIVKGKDKEGDIEIKYIPQININVIKQLGVFFYTFFKLLFTGLGKEKPVVVCDVLKVSNSMAIACVSKIRRLKTVGIMTDMPGLGASNSLKKPGFIKKIVGKLTKASHEFALYNYSHYVFLTESMNDVINIHNRPYIIMEGLCDKEMAHSEIEEKYEKRTIMYAGRLNEEYGLKKLTEAFMQLPQENIELLIFGGGPYAEKLKANALKDPRIKYMGLAPNEDVVKAELKATLLVNPRPTHEEFTKYSFPSKNMEYMASGTPLLTTKLPGMPTEYYSYVLLIEDEMLQGYVNALNNALSKSNAELNDLGARAKDWILNNKNNSVQAKRIIELAKQ